MNIKLKIKEVREEKGISLRKLEDETGIERERLSDIENEKITADKILFVEMVVISQSLACRISDLYELEYLEIKGIGEIWTSKSKKPLHLKKSIS